MNATRTFQTSDILNWLGPRIERSDAVRAIEGAMQALDLTEPFSSADLFRIFEILGQYEGIVGITARFAKARAILAIGADTRDGP